MFPGFITQSPGYAVDGSTLEVGACPANSANQRRSGYSNGVTYKLANGDWRAERAPNVALEGRREKKKLFEDIRESDTAGARAFRKRPRHRGFRTRYVRRGVRLA